MRNRFASILFVGIVPSNGSQEPKSLNPYLDVLVDELLELSSTTLHDAYSNAPFECKTEDCHTLNIFWITLESVKYCLWWDLEDCKDACL